MTLEIQQKHIIKRRSGFTLIELLVVVAIISIIASVVLSSLDSARTRVNDTARYNDLSQMETALALYYDDHGQYPDTGNSWWTSCSHDQDPTPRGTSGPNGYVPDLAPNYISELPLDPQGCEDRSMNYGRGHFGNYIYRSNGYEYKFSADWSAEKGYACDPGSRFWDPARGEGGSHGEIPVDGVVFCSIYSSGAALW